MGGPCLEGARGERAEGNRQEERKPCLCLPHPEKGRTRLEGNGGAPVPPERLEVGGVPVRKHPEGPATPGKPPHGGETPVPGGGSDLRGFRCPDSATHAPAE